MKDVTEDGPADKAGVKVNDIVTAVNGNEIDGRRALSNAVGAAAPGETLTLTVYRQGETLDIDVTVEEKTEPALPDQEEAPEQDENADSQDDGDPLDPQQDQDGSRDDELYDLFDEFMRQFGGRGA